MSLAARHVVSLRTCSVLEGPWETHPLFYVKYPTPCGFKSMFIIGKGKDISDDFKRCSSVAGWWETRVTSQPVWLSPFGFPLNHPTEHNNSEETYMWLVPTSHTHFCPDKEELFGLWVRGGKNDSLKGGLVDNMAPFWTPVPPCAALVPKGPLLFDQPLIDFDKQTTIT